MCVTVLPKRLRSSYCSVRRLGQLICRWVVYESGIDLYYYYYYYEKVEIKFLFCLFKRRSHCIYTTKTVFGPLYLGQKLLVHLGLLKSRWVNYGIKGIEFGGCLGPILCVHDDNFEVVVVVVQGGGWCNDIKSCAERANTRRGSTRYMSKWEVFSGILSNNASLNPDFYNWNRVKLRYCDGASFAGDSMFYNGTTLLYFRGQKIWEAIIQDLLPKGLGQARKALLSGCSAGGLSSFLHCDSFKTYLPTNASVKCLSDAGFFLDERDISLNHTMRFFYKGLVSLQEVEKNLNKNCTSSLYFPELCIFPQYTLKYITTPFFILNSAYDVFQFHHALVPPSADPRGVWSRCKQDPSKCRPNQINILQGLRRDMLLALGSFFNSSTRGGMFINSCFAHCQSETQNTWFGVDSPRIHNKTIAETVGDWYFSRRLTNKEIDCAYPCGTNCHNLIQ